MKRIGALILIMLMCASVAFAEIDEFILPSAVKNIEEEAFVGIDTDKIVLPNGVETIGPRAFAQSGATSVNLPSSLTSIADDAFEDCTLTEVAVTDNTYAYNWAARHGYVSKDYAFEIDAQGNASIFSTSLTVEKCFEVPAEIDGHPVVAIGKDVWKNQTELVRVVLPETMLSIGEGAFSGCEKLACVVFSGSDTVISTGAFTNCAQGLTFFAAKNTDAQRYAGVIGADFIETGVGDRYLLLVGPDAQSSEEAQAAAEIATANPTSVICVNVPAVLTAQNVQMILQSAGNPDLKAIIAAPASQGLEEPFAAIRTDYGRTDLLLVSGSMYGVSDDLAAVSDFCITLDGAAMGRQIADFAEEKGCLTAVIFTCASESGTKTIQDLTSALQANFKQVMTFECLDPSVVGIQKAASDLQSSITAGIQAAGGTRTCFFCSDDRLQYAAEQIIANNSSAYLALPFTPSPYAGFQQAFGLSGTGSKDTVLQEITYALNQCNGKNRFSTWGVSPRMLMIESAYNYALQVAGGVAQPFNPQAFAACASECADETVNCSTTGNVFSLSLTPVDFGDYDETTVYRALIIGEYNNVSGISNNLPFSTKNCSFMNAVLTKSNINGARYTVERDSANPTKETIQSKIQSTFADADDNDVSLIYIVSHGYVSTNRGYYFGIPKAKTPVAEEFYSDELMSMLRYIPGSVVLILDSCKSGAFISDMRQYLDLCGNISVLTAQTGDQNASYYVGKDSANTMEFLTYAFTKGLNYDAGYEAPGLYADTNHDGKVTARESFVYAKDETVKQVNIKKQDYNPKSDYGFKVPGIDTQEKMNAWSQQPQTYYSSSMADTIIYGE